MESPCSAKNSQTTVRSESELEEYSPSSDESAGGFHVPESKVRNTRKFDLDFAMARYRAQLAYYQQRERRQQEGGEGGKDKPAIFAMKKASTPKKCKSKRCRSRAAKDPASSRSQH